MNPQTATVPAAAPSNIAPPAIFGPIETPRASDIFAARVREWILSEHHPDGTPLPSERQLMEQTGLGRSTIREALRILQTEGLVTSKVGPKGGYTVRRPDLQTVIDSVTVFLRSQRFRFRSLIETRLAIEPTCARLAAERATDADLKALEVLEERMEDPSLTGEALARANFEWHLALAQASHNELLVALMTALSSVMNEASSQIARNLSEDVEKARPDIKSVHTRVLEALKEKDPEAAERRMRRHVEAYAVLVEGIASDEDLPGAKR